MKAFDELLTMSDVDITTYRKQMAQRLINAAPKSDRLRLHTLQKSIDLELKYSATPLEGVEGLLAGLKAKAQRNLNQAEEILTNLKAEIGE